MAHLNFNGLNNMHVMMGGLLCLAMLMMPVAMSHAETIIITPKDSKFFDKYKSKQEISEEQHVQEMLKDLKVEEDLNFSEHGFLRSDKALDRADFLIKSGQYSKAIGVVNRMLQRHPKNAEFYVYKGFINRKLNDKAAARKSFKRALSLDAAHLGGLYQMALMDAETGDMAQAQEKLTLIRMYCGHTNCAEATQLEIKLDKISVK